MATRGVRVAVAGATGALGTEVLSVLDATRVPIAQLVAVASEGSLGSDIEFRGDIVSVATDLPPLHGLDVLIACTPPAAAPDIVRAALRAEVPCVDASGAFALRPEVPLVWAADGDVVDAVPLLASPVDAALVWLPVLRALAALAPLAAADATILEAASASGRAGIDALSLESLALFNQQEVPESAVLDRSLAFDCHATSGELIGGRRSREVALASMLARRLDPAPTVSARWIQVPVFVGQLSNLTVSFERPVDAASAAEALGRARGVEVWDGAREEGPNLRAAAGRDVVLASRPELSATRPDALRLWAAADLLRLAAANAVALAIRRWEAAGALEARGAH